jgi:hypothetical protein
MEEAPRKARRRRLKFGLGTIFVVVTVVAVFLAYHINWIRQRHDLLRAQSMLGAEHDYARSSTEPWSAVNAPGLLWLFGERGQYRIRFIIIDNTADPSEELRAAQRLFPETKFQCLRPSGNGTTMPIYP